MRKILLFLLAAAVLAVPSTADAAKKPRYLLSLGDSLGAGYNKDASGVTRDNGADYSPLPAAKPRKPTSRLRLVNLSCPGESTPSFQRDRGCPLPRVTADDRSQLSRAVEFLKAHRGQVKAVTLSLSSNNFTFCTS